MGGVVHRSFVWTIVAALIVSGATWRACTAGHLPPASFVSAPPSHAQPSHEHHSHAAAHHEHHGDDSDRRHGGGHHGAGPRGQAADNPGQAALDDHACLKCCSMCTVASIVAGDASPAVLFTISAVLFSIEQGHRSDRTVLIDPGIPKRIV
jgi:hypothetical protein